MIPVTSDLDISARLVLLQAGEIACDAQGAGAVHTAPSPNDNPSSGILAYYQNFTQFCD